MTTEIETAQTEVRDDAYETTPVSGWGWPAEALLTELAEMADRTEQADQPIKDDSAYAALYFVS